MFDPLRVFKYYIKVLLGLAILWGPLLILAIWTEHRMAVAQEQTLFSVPGVLRLLRDMLPSVLGVGAALFLAASFMASLYEVKDWRDGAGHIWRCIFGQPQFSPFMKVSNAEVQGTNDNILVRIGGPGGILVDNDSAVVLERGGRLTRVLGPGQISQLKPFEKVHDVLDVRPMHWEYEVGTLSKEGIPVTVSVAIDFQIDTDGRQPLAETPYPASDDAIFRASTSRWMRQPGNSEDDQYFDWARRVVIGETEGSLRSIIARYPLDVLIGWEETSSSGAPQSRPRQDIQNELTNVLRGSCKGLGAQINKVQLGTIKVDKEITGQWFEAWWYDWHNWTMIEERKGESEREKIREAAKAQAQVEIITKVAGAFQKSVSKDDSIPSQLLVMRLVEVFDRFAIEPDTRIYLPNQAIETLENLQKLFI